MLAEDAEKAKNNVKTFGGRQLSISFVDKKPKHENRKCKQAGDVKDGDDEGNASELLTMKRVLFVCLVVHSYQAKKPN